ncbi:hypothetical protein [Paraburkholderia sp. J94]|uniref:hypothetical protein n=1 Tax=Paraburkholderia sp. J94 TaxID=2805441 RepID=UPI002AB0A123|nr:hypothetical protein [Paraburkholderia sp. J94]
MKFSARSPVWRALRAPLAAPRQGRRVSRNRPIFRARRAPYSEGVARPRHTLITPRKGPIMLAATLQRLSQPAAARLARVCERASRLGIALLPVVYIAFFAALFVLGVMQHIAFALTAAALTLGGTMLAGALIFYLASAAPQAVPASHASARARAHAQAPSRAVHAVVPIRFARMPTRTCEQTCTTAAGEEMRISVNCYQAHCAAANRAEPHGRPTRAS